MSFNIYAGTLLIIIIGIRALRCSLGEICDLSLYRSLLKIYSNLLHISSYTSTRIGFIGMGEFIFEEVLVGN